MTQPQNTQPTPAGSAAARFADAMHAGWLARRDDPQAQAETRRRDAEERAHAK